MIKKILLICTALSIVLVGCGAPDIESKPAPVEVNKNRNAGKGD